MARSGILGASAALLWCAAGVSALTIEAQRARVKDAGTRTPTGWNLHSNGRLGDYVRCAEAGTFEVTVRAYGSSARGVWPRMALLVDGAAEAAVTVAGKESAAYAFKVQLAAGPHLVAVAFTNDAVVGDEDRNLYLERIDIRGAGGAADPVLASRKEVVMEAQAREDAAVKAARQDIEKHRKAGGSVRVVDAEGRPVPGASVTVEQTRHEFLFGCNIYRFDRYKTPERNEAYKRRFGELFNYATLGFYWRSYEPQRGKPAYDYTDRIVAWCQEHKIRMKGHPLLWGHQAGRPKWAGGRQPAPEIQQQRVTEIVRRFRGKIEFWEVVNEPAHCHEVKIDAPYRWARAADPKAYLIVNDYYVMANGYPPFFALLTKARAGGVPFDGIGIQAHEPRTMRFPLDQVRRILDRYAALGKDLHVTEFSPASGGKAITGSHVEGVWDLAAQADYAAKFYTVCFAHPAMMAVTWWDLCDDGSWLPGGGMLRKDMTPKPVYTALRKLIHQTWRTRAEGKTDKAGTFAFRGFRGSYRLNVAAAGRTAQADARLTKDAPNDFRVTLGR